MTSWTPPPVWVLGVRQNEDRTLVTVKLHNDLCPPLAPSSLLFDDGSITELDAVVKVDGLTAVFRTHQAVSEGVIGATAGFQQWWTPEGHAAITDIERQWVRESSLTDHEHCLLDWTKIGSPSGSRSGWRSGKDWLCNECYDRYIVRDHLGIRG